MFFLSVNCSFYVVFDCCLRSIDRSISLIEPITIQLLLFFSYRNRLLILRCCDAISEIGNGKIEKHIHTHTQHNWLGKLYRRKTVCRIRLWKTESKFKIGIESVRFSLIFFCYFLCFGRFPSFICSFAVLILAIDVYQTICLCF